MVNFHMQCLYILKLFTRGQNPMQNRSIQLKESTRTKMHKWGFIEERKQGVKLVSLWVSCKTWLPIGVNIFLCCFLKIKIETIP
jgi:hypothetical protein